MSHIGRGPGARTPTNVGEYTIERPRTRRENPRQNPLAFDDSNGTLISDMAGHLGRLLSPRNLTPFRPPIPQLPASSSHSRTPASGASSSAGRDSAPVTTSRGRHKPSDSDPIIAGQSASITPGSLGRRPPSSDGSSPFDPTRVFPPGPPQGSISWFTGFTRPPPPPQSASVSPVIRPKTATGVYGTSIPPIRSTDGFIPPVRFSTPARPATTAPTSHPSISAVTDRRCSSLGLRQAPPLIGSDPAVRPPSRGDGAGKGTPRVNSPASSSSDERIVFVPRKYRSATASSSSGTTQSVKKSLHSYQGNVNMAELGMRTKSRFFPPQ